MNDNFITENFVYFCICCYFVCFFLSECCDGWRGGALAMPQILLPAFLRDTVMGNGLMLKYLLLACIYIIGIKIIC